MGKIIKAISKDGSISCHIIDSTDIVFRAEKFHATSATATAALGRLLTAASLIGSKMKFEEESITLRVKGEGPIGAIVAVGDYKGNVKGYVENPIVEIPLNSIGKLDVAGAVGANGQLNVMRDFGAGDPYIGTTDMVSGEIAEDITAYYAQSEQVPTACALGVLVNPDLSVRQAGGFLIQLLPDAFEESITQLETNIRGLKPFTTLLDEGNSVNDILDIVMNNIDYEILEETEAAYVCGCSRERMEKALISVGKKELETLRDEDEVTEISCHFCNKKYRFNKEEISRLIQIATKE